MTKSHTFLTPPRHLCLWLGLINLPMSAMAITLTNHQAADLVLGQANFTANASGATANTLYDPVSVAVDPTSNKVFVSDYPNCRVLRFGSVTSLTNGAAAEAVLGQPNFTSNTCTTSATGLNLLGGVFVDSAGRLWVSDFNNNRVLRFDNASTIATGAAANGVLGQSNFTTGASGGATQSTLSNPKVVVIDSAGRLWVTDQSNHRVLRFDNAASKANGANADGVLGQPDFTSNGSSTTQNGMTQPEGITIDSAGNLFVADYNNRRVLRFNNAATKANGANADAVLGQPNFTSNTNVVSATGMGQVRGVAIDNLGQLYVSDADNNNRILIYQNAATLGNGAAASYVLGQPDFTSATANNGGVSATSLSFPYGLFFDNANGSLWTTDFNNNRVLRYTTNTVPIATVASISGTLQVGQTVTGNYSYTDAESDPQGTSTFQWYTATDTACTASKTAIAGAMAVTYTLTATEVGKYVCFEVTPVASSGASPGIAVLGTSSGVVVNPPVPLPVVPPLPDQLGLFLQLDGTGKGKVTSDTGLSCQSSDCQKQPDDSLACNPQMCSQTVQTATTVTLTPQADVGSYFSSWGGSSDCLTSPLWMNGGKLCIAYFHLLDEPLTVIIQGQGSVTATSLNCPGTCTANYPYNTTMTLQTQPAAGWQFQAWSGDCSTGQVLMTSTKNCGATFMPNPATFDEDLDHIPSAIEDAAPNHGDGNGDGILDSQQNNVASFVDAVNGVYLTLQVDKTCPITNVYGELPDKYPGVDRNHHFPQGLTYFELSCAKTQVTVYYHGIHRLYSNLRFYKYGPTVPGDLKTVAWYQYPATYAVVQIGGQPVLTATYTLTDGQLGDSTGVDGKIVDPAGIMLK